MLFAQSEFDDTYDENSLIHLSSGNEIGLLLTAPIWLPIVLLGSYQDKPIRTKAELEYLKTIDEIMSDVNQSEIKKEE